MNIAPTDVILLAHAGFGGLGVLLALWVAIEALNARAENAARTRGAAWATATSMAVAWILGGYWYIHFYPADKALILRGSWPLAHNVFMETKEHLFFLTFVLSVYLVIAARGNLAANSSSRRLVLCVSLLIVLSGLAVEGFGAVVNHGAEVALRAKVKGTP